MRRLATFLLVGGMLNLATPPAVAQSLENSSPAQLRHLIQEGRADTNKVQALLRLGSFYMRKDEVSKQELDSTLMLATQAMALGRRLGVAKGVDGALFLTGQVYAKRQETHRAMGLMPSLRDTSKIKLLLALGNEQFPEVHGSKARTDSALFFMQQAIRLSAALGQRAWQEESQLQLGALYMRLDDVARGEPFFRQVIGANQRAGNKTSEMKAWYRMGNGYAYEERFNPQYFAQMRACFQPAVALARQIHNREYEGLARKQLAVMLYYEGKLPQAEEEMLQVVAIQKASGSKELHFIYAYLANISQNRGYLNRSLAYTLQIIKILKDEGRITDLDYPYYKLASIYYTTGQFEKTIDALKKSLAVSHQKGEVATRAALGMLVRLMTMTLLKQGKAAEALLFVQDIAQRKTYADPRDDALIAASFGDCYMALKQYTLAEQYYQKSLVLNNQLGPSYSLSSNLSLARLYVATRQYAKAESRFKQIAAVPPGKVPLLTIQEIHLLGYQTDSALGHYLPAMAHLRQREAIKDSIFNTAKSRQMEELQVQFETKEKEQNIQLLTEKGLRQQSNLQRAQTARNTTIAGALLLLLLLALGYNRYRLKQRSNQRLEAQQREINEKNHSLEVVLTEKEWLLKEIHHRVKNNLQIIISLLQSQSKYLLDEAAINAIEQSQHRVRAMALIHQKLYRSESLSRIDMPAYIKEVVEQLSECFDPEEQIRFRFQLAPLELDVTQAVPLGLIINEAITNALKYAFPPNFRPDGHGGTVDLTLAEVDAGHYLLVVADDGVGMPADVDLRRSNSMGANIMRGLSKQLGGDLQVASGRGVTISVPFTLVQLQPHYAEAS
ncbi:histidine kinase dimerization/phosphoacceptor domain -containing protein [Hymenobacter negativus]|uniref:Tetratricopeptide repeat protein n=1 Tax=Hymenobacter negativus TaxID=2795026 RepID=A0ABS3QFF1_9BACT|nr:histidine kinase dimerization/phosphoacceptor domain -containing protein [Hymenobacter negativus]MBO2009980.1 tetratricopeptide repeat protein [Hymenobacter negativus]